MLTKTECTVLRGFAIIGIVLHNYCHWLSVAVKENEFLFTKSNSEAFLHTLLHPDATLPVQLFSFFGHYGVPVFLFLSGYGLVMKYEKAASDRLSARQFLRIHFLKLFRMMIVGFAAFVLVDAMMRGTFRYTAEGIVAQLLMLNNLLPHPDHVIWPGPYWFFGLMLQLYAVYCLLFYRRHWGYVLLAVALCWLMQVFCDPHGDMLNRLRYNCIGGILPFGMGILYARYAKEYSRQTYIITALCSTAAVLLFNFSYWSWLWVPLFVVTLHVSLIKLLPVRRMNWMVWVGSISMPLFVAHPITRRIIIPISQRGDLYTGLLLYILTSIAAAWLFAQLYKKIPEAGK